jgi:hypothetical protein
LKTHSEPELLLNASTIRLGSEVRIFNRPPLSAVLGTKTNISGPPLGSGAFEVLTKKESQRMLAFLQFY